jgi:hypothetical protein
LGGRPRLKPRPLKRHGLLSRTGPQPHSRRASGRVGLSLRLGLRWVYTVSERVCWYLKSILNGERGGRHGGGIKRGGGMRAPGLAAVGAEATKGTTGARGQARTATHRYGDK